MNGSDYPQDERRVATGKVPSLIHDYRAQRDAWREQARNLARMREEVLTAADREAHDIVTTARTDIRAILLKARRDLLVLAAQVRAAGRLGDADDTPDVTFLPSDDLGQAHNALTSARHDIRRVLDDSRPELEGLVSEGEALRAALRQQRPPAPTPIRQHRHVIDTPTQDIAARPGSDTTIDFEFTTIAAEQPVDFAIRSHRRPGRVFIAAAATLGAVALMGTTWWFVRPPSKTAKSAALESKVTSVTAPAASRTDNAAFRGSPIPNTRSPLTIGLAARRTAWIRITADGRVTAERTFRAGETQLISASKEISIRAGDAGAVTVAVGGRQPVALGREGDVVTRKFAVETPRVELPRRPEPSTPPSATGVPAESADSCRPGVARACASACRRSTSIDNRSVLKFVPNHDAAAGYFTSTHGADNSTARPTRERETASSNDRSARRTAGAADGRSDAVFAAGFTDKLRSAMVGCLLSSGSRHDDVDLAAGQRHGRPWRQRAPSERPEWRATYARRCERAGRQ
jgi:hypothetical protein